MNLLISDLLGKLNLVVLGKEVGFKVDLSDLLLVNHEFLEEVTNTVVVDEVGADAKLAQLRVGVGEHTITDGLETGLTNAIVADIEELNGAVDLEECTDRSCTIDIEDVPVEVERLQSGVLVESLRNSDDTGNTDVGAAQV